ncbi:DELLA protein RGL2 [Melia azedarach]|uniref:DELLA protein RGL2 n=1 Tax=Melia azedarach TaxID=155640 RepID=A0ACC1YXA2_MELAZ|nr:DELLA protein RGL2 [Melia azedarach]
MANTLFSFTSFDFNGIQGRYSTLLGDYHKEEVVLLEEKQAQMFSIEELGEVNPDICPEFGAYQEQEENITKKGPHLLEEQHQLLQHQNKLPNHDLLLNELHPNFAFSTTQSFQEMPKLKSVPTSTQEVLKPVKEIPQPFAFSSLELLSNYANGSKKLKTNLPTHMGNESNPGSSKKLSTEEIMRVAGARYVHFSDQSYDDFSMVMHPFGYALSGLSEEETRDVELVHLLLAAAEKVGYQQFERASRLLSRCEWIAAERANPVQRIVFYFAGALRERINRETGNMTSKELESTGLSLADHRNGLGSNPVFLKCYQRLPFSQVMYLTGIQAIIENIGNANKIHLIDFEIRSGVQWTSFMQALAERQQRPIQLLKITAVAFRNKEKVEETGKSLASFAESLNLPFQFKVVYISSFLEIKEQLFEIKNDETLVVYCSLILRIMISHPSCLESLLGAIRKLNPSLMVVIEVEANHNSPSFVNRFIEALFYYSALFDSLDTCWDDCTETRTMMEAIFDAGIRNIVAMEGAERSVRNVKMDVWRAFFSRYRMVEIGLSDQCLYQANLVLKQFSCASSCTLGKNGKSLIIGWKGTPIHSVSAWKFSRERGRSFLNYRF